VGESEFGNTNRLGSEVKSDQARRSGHGVKGLNRNSKMPKKNFYSEIQPGGMRCPQHVGYTCALSPDFLRLRRTEHVVLNALANCRLMSCAFGESPIIVLTTSQSTFSLLGPLHAYLEKEEARIFGELPLQFSNDAPALI
jgi:hypothetical protein